MQPILERFNQYFTKQSSGCWEWQGSCTADGYGKFWMDGKNVAAHRASFILNHRKNPDGKMVLHTCDNPRCVNPDHLVLGTHRDNVLHMKERNRFLVGEQNGNSKITSDDARKIIKELLGGGKVRAVARQFGHSRNLVKAISNKMTWRHIWEEFTPPTNPPAC